GWRRIYDDEWIATLRLDHGQQAEKLIDARRCQLHQLGGATSAGGETDSGAKRRTDFVQGGLEADAPGCEERRRIDFPNMQISRTAADLDRPVANPLSEHVTERMCRIGREQQHDP